MAWGRSTKAEHDQRVDEIYGLLLSRVSYASICRYASQRWQVTPRQTDRYIGAARQRILELLGPDQREQLAKALGGYETIFSRQMAAGDLRGARATMKDVVDLLGLSASDRQRMPEDSHSAVDDWLAALRAEPRDREDQSA